MNIHQCDNTSSIKDWFPAKAVYILTLTKESYTITYTDGVKNEEVFADQRYTGVEFHAETPGFDTNLTTEGIQAGEPEREGYTFKGWAAADNLDPKFDELVIRDRTYVAQWEKIPDPTYGVTYEFVSEDGTNLPAEVTSKLATSDINTYKVGVTATNNAPATYDVVEVKENGITVGTWTFQGWDANSKEMVAGGIKFVGTWEYEAVDKSDNDVEYRFVSDTAGQTLPVEVTSQLTTSDSATYYVGQVVTNNAPATYTAVDVKENNITVGTWTFKGWDGTSKEMVAGGIEFVGTWEYEAVDKSKNTVAYEFVSDPVGQTLPDGVTSQLTTSDSATYYVGQEVTNKAPTTYNAVDVKENNITVGTWTFNGWDETSKEMVAGGIKFTGTWTYTEAKKYTVTYLIDSAPYGDAESYYAGATVTVKSAPDNREGYTFSGWSTSDAIISNGSFSMPDKDVVLKGKFIANTNTAYKVEHYKQKLDGTGYDLADTENKTGTTGATATATAKTYEGFTFDENVLGTVKSGPIAANGSLVLKLYYTRDTYTVTYKVDSAVYGTPATYKYGEEVTVQADASKPGYTFSGWSTADVTISEGKFTMPAKNVTIVGSFTKQCDVAVEKDVYQLKDAKGEIFYSGTDAPVADLAIPAVKAGDTIIWKIVVNNTGDEAGSFTLTDLLSGIKLYDEQFQDVDPTSVAINGGQSITYYAEYKVTEADEAEIVNKVKVQSGSTEKTDEAPGVSVANISVTKKADKTSVRVGDKVTYTITVKNEGSVTLYDVKVTDEFTTGGKGSKVAKEGIWNVDELAPGDSFVAKLIYTTVSSDTNGLKNTAVAEGTYDGQKTVDETATVDVTVKREPITPVGPSKPQLNYEDHYAYVVGYPDGLVHPERNITRAEVATIFFRMLLDESREYFWAQENDFSDVAETDWFNNAVSTLANAQLINGYPDGSYRPNANITRAEFATIAIRFFLDEDVEIEENNLSDVKGHWAEANINLAYALELINGYPDGTFRPDQKITRAEAMAIVNRVLKRAPEKDHLLKDMIEWPDNLNTAAWYYADVQEATNSHKFHMDKEEEYEIWTELLPVRDWVALEQEWSKANSSKNPGEVVDIKITTPEAGDNGLKLD